MLVVEFVHCLSVSGFHSARLTSDGNEQARERHNSKRVSDRIGPLEKGGSVFRLDVNGSQRGIDNLRRKHSCHDHNGHMSAQSSVFMAATCELTP